MDINDEIENLKNLFDKENIEYELNPFIKVSSNTIKRFQKILPNIPATFIIFFNNFNRFNFKWSDGKISVINILHLVNLLEKNRGYTKINKQQYITLINCQNTNLICQIGTNNVNLFFSISISINGRHRNLVFPLNLPLDKYFQKAIIYRGVPFWEFLENQELWTHLNTSVSFSAYIKEINNIYLKPKQKRKAWGSIINEELNHLNPIKIKEQLFEKRHLISPTQISIELHLGHSIHPEIANYYSEIKNSLAIRLTIKNRIYSNFKIASYRELFEEASSFFWNYIGISKRKKNKKEHYSYKVLIYKECPVFIDLKSKEKHNLYYYEHSENQLYKINLTFNQFLFKLFACRGVENWERLFIGKNYVDEDVISKIKEVNPNIDIDSFINKK